MSRKQLVLLIWLVIGVAAAGQRGYFDHTPAGCSGGATIAVTLITGPLNYLGIDPQIACNWPTPAS